MNNAVRPNFKVVFAKKSTCESHEQCTGPILCKTQTHVSRVSALSKHSLILLNKNPVSYAINISNE